MSIVTPIHAINVHYIVDPCYWWRFCHYKTPTLMCSPTNMADHFYPNHFTNPPWPQLEPDQWAAYLLGMGPMPPPHPQEVAVAAAVHLLDHGSGMILMKRTLTPSSDGRSRCKHMEIKVFLYWVGCMMILMWYRYSNHCSHSHQQLLNSRHQLLHCNSTQRLPEPHLCCHEPQSHFCTAWMED